MSQYHSDNTWFTIFCNSEMKAKYSFSNVFVHLHSFYRICLKGKYIAFNGTENIQFFKSCYLTVKVFIYIFLLTFETKNLKYHI